MNSFSPWLLTSGTCEAVAPAVELPGWPLTFDLGDMRGSCSRSWTSGITGYCNLSPQNLWHDAENSRACFACIHSSSLTHCAKPYLIIFIQGTDSVLIIRTETKIQDLLGVEKCVHLTKLKDLNRVNAGMQRCYTVEDCGVVEFQGVETIKNRTPLNSGILAKSFLCWLHSNCYFVMCRTNKNGHLHEMFSVGWYCKIAYSTCPYRVYDSSCNELWLDQMWTWGQG